jgi:hypothetical protein
MRDNHDDSLDERQPSRREAERNRHNAGWMRDSRKFIMLKDERQIKMLAGCVRNSRQDERLRDSHNASRLIAGRMLDIHNAVMMGDSHDAGIGWVTVMTLARWRQS